jgi:hypothetical protein
MAMQFIYYITKIKFMRKCPGKKGRREKYYYLRGLGPATSANELLPASCLAIVINQAL